MNFTSSSVNTLDSFNLRDGIYVVPYSGSYLFSVHALPMRERPLRLQIHRNGVAVAAISNGDNGSADVILKIAH